MSFRRPLRCSDHVREVGGRHVARVLMIETANSRPLWAKLKWLDSNWISERVPVDTLELAPADTY